MKYINITIVLTLALTGCASLQPKPYKEPSTGQTATLTIANKSDARLRVWQMNNAENCSQTSYVNGAPGLPAQTSLKLKYAADQKIAFYITGLQESTFQKKQCSFIFSTKLTPDEQYLLIYSFEEDNCRLVEAKMQADGTPIRQSFLVQREYTAGGELFGWCKSEH
ncbi:hypothetical protein [Aquabacterium sp.]|uniref:hypothetical protein n=1 Tax=Aquabacterium sp. TaxID=1872578 RepID=UPI003D6CA571